MGFPFFAPAYVPGNRIRIYGGHVELAEALRRQQAAPSFPVDFASLRATIEFVLLEAGKEYDIAGLRVSLMLQRHAGDSYGFRFTSGGRTVIYTTDSEHTLEDPAQTASCVDFFRGADVVIFDAMYSLADAISVKTDCGHSRQYRRRGIVPAGRGARQLCLFHHEPIHGDDAIARVLAETQRYEELTRTGKPLLVTAAYDGMEIDLSVNRMPSQARASRRIWSVGLLTLGLLAALIGAEPSWNARLQLFWFDAFQMLAPRKIEDDTRNSR
jgi:phosphoribosyl 1,2-cyclic phosphodiesterase